MPYFSVVIPLYNKQNYIAATLQSVLAQTFTDFEIIVIDDVSTDDSLAVAQSVNDRRIHIIKHDKNSGLSASRNTGIKNASAVYIAFLDADDLWKPDFLKEIYTLTTDYPEADIFATKYEELYPENSIIERPFLLKTGIVDNYFLIETYQHIYCYSSICIRKQITDKIGLFNESITMCEDIDYNIRANLMFTLAYSNKALATITMHSENQISHSALHNKTIVDHDYYEDTNPENTDLKKYLDFHRYTMANRYKLAGDKINYQKMVNSISLSNLNYKQILLLYIPAFGLKLIKKLKVWLIKRGINPTTYLLVKS